MLVLKVEDILKKRKSDSSVMTLILLRKFISVDYFTVIINSKKVAKSAVKITLHGKIWTTLVQSQNGFMSVSDILRRLLFLHFI